MNYHNHIMKMGKSIEVGVKDLEGRRY